MLDRPRAQAEEEGEEPRASSQAGAEERGEQLHHQRQRHRHLRDPPERASPGDAKRLSRELAKVLPECCSNGRRYAGGVRCPSSATTIFILALAAGCGSTKLATDPLGVARAWAKAQRSAHFAKACDLSTLSTVRWLGGRDACARFYARYPYGRHVEIDPGGLQPRRPGTYAVINHEPGRTDYGAAVRAIRDRGEYRVQIPPQHP